MPEVTSTQVDSGLDWSSRGHMRLVLDGPGSSRSHHHEHIVTAGRSGGETAPACLVTDALGYGSREMDRSASPGNRGCSSCARGPDPGG